MNQIQRDLALLHEHYGPEFLAELATYLRRARIAQKQEYDVCDGCGLPSPQSNPYCFCSRQQGAKQ